MILIETVLGDMRDAAFASRLHRLEHAEAVDTISLGSADLARRRLRVTSERGTEVAIALPRDQTLFDGAVLQLEDGHALVVRAAPTDWLRIITRDSAAALELGYQAGNLHWRVRFDGSALLVAMDAPREIYAARIARLALDGRRCGVDMIATLLAMQQADAAFPSGSFAFSNGIEGVAALPYPFDRTALLRHAQVALRHRWAGLDRIALVRAWRTDGEISILSDIDDAVEAANVVASFREGSRRAGRALLTTHARLATPGADAIKSAIAQKQLLGHLPTMQGALFRALGVPKKEAIAIAGYQAVASLTSAAVRLGRIGALDAQSVVRDMLPEIATLTAPEAIDPDADLASFAPFLDIAAMRSADADFRLFSS